MDQTVFFIFRPLNRLRVAAGVVLLLTCVLGIWAMSVDLRHQIDRQSSSSLDHAQWALSQVEVDLIRLVLAVEKARGATGTLSDLRLRFDEVDSRLDTLNKANSFAGLRDAPDFASHVGPLNGFAAANRGLIAGPNPVLRQNLAGLSGGAIALLPEAREVALAGARYFATRADRDRRTVGRTLNFAAALTILLIASLAGLVVLLLRLDLANRRSSAQNLQTLSRLDAIVATAQEAIVTVDEQGRIVDFNGAATRTFGHARSDVVGHDLATLMSDGEQTVFHPGRAPVLHGPGLRRIMARHQSGRLFPVELSMSQTQSGNAPLYVAFMRDLSVQLAAERALMSARDTALAGEKAKSDLLVVMSHEIRTPLNGMIGSIDLLGATDMQADQKEYLRILEASGQLLMHHVNDVLDIARLDSDKAGHAPGPVDLQVLVQEVLDNQSASARANGNTMHFTGPADGRVSVVADGVLLRQILLNLVGNAVKFTRQGTIEVRVCHSSPTGPTVISVADSGLGIAEADLDRVFDDFVTLDASHARSVSGTGLGLGIVKRIVARMGGQVQVKSQAGQGSVFRVILPLPILPLPILAAQTGPCATDPPQAQTPQNRALSVLVIEDNATNRTIIRHMLVKQGHSVVEAQDGLEGIALASEQCFDVILMDISMPGADGLQATRVIACGQGASRATPIIAMTAHALTADSHRFAAAGMRVTLTKPITRPALNAALAAVLDPDATPPVPIMPAPTMPAPALALIDVTVLQDMASDLGPDRAAGLLHTFLTETAQSLSTLAAQHQLDQTSLRELHQLEGSAALFGAVALRQALSHLQTAARSGQTDQIRAGLTGLPDLWHQTRSAYGKAGVLPQLSSLR